MTDMPTILPASGIRNLAPAAFHVTAKPRGAVCNLNCMYCFYLSKTRLYPGSDSRMSDELLEKYVRQQLEAHHVPEVIFTWQGGEPTLMGLNFFRRVLELQHKYRKPGTQIHNALQTNGTTLTEEWCKFFHHNRFLLGISIDGPCRFHDAYRIDKSGAPTFDRVMAGIALLEKHRVEFNVLTAVHAVNAGHGLQVYRFLRDEVQAQMIQFIPIVEQDSAAGFQEGAKMTSRSVTGRQYGEFLIAVFDEWVRHDVGRVFVQIFDIALGVWFGQPSSLCTFSKTCGDALALEHNGDLFSCDHFVGPNHKIGNIAETPLSELVTSPHQRKFGLDKHDTLPHCCRECSVRFICNGGCPKDRILTTADTEVGLNYLCEGFKAFFSHIDRPMQIMASLLRQRRSPAHIMRLISGTTGKSVHYYDLR
jgi:uncharacterized protein